MSETIEQKKHCYISSSEEDTKRIADKVAEKLDGGETILLDGELGAGKTTFTKELLRFLGVEETVTSPTFTLMKTYYGKFTFHHIDMYRIADEDEVEELGLREEIEKNDITLIEWNKFSDFYGKVIKISIRYIDQNSRKIEITGIEL